MNLTADERRALVFVVALLLVSAAVRALALPEPVEVPGAGAGAGFDLDAHVAATQEKVAAAERAARPLADGERIDPNTADAIELDRLPGVGPALAGRIVEDRDRNGPYRRPEDLQRVTGVGARTLERMAPRLELPEAAVGSRSAPSAGPPRLARSARAGVRDPPPRGATAGARVNLNTADPAALEALPGIGPALAQRIIAYRDSAGTFRTAEDLMRVRGIGPATLERIRGRIAPGG